MRLFAEMAEKDFKELPTFQHSRCLKTPAQFAVFTTFITSKFCLQSHFQMIHFFLQVKNDFEFNISKSLKKNPKLLFVLRIPQIKRKCALHKLGSDMKERCFLLDGVGRMQTQFI